MMTATDRALDHAIVLGVDPVNLDDASVILPDSGGWISITDHTRHGWQTVTVYDRHGRIVRVDECPGPYYTGRMVARRAGVLLGSDPHAGITDPEETCDCGEC